MGGDGTGSAEPGPASAATTAPISPSAAPTGWRKISICQAVPPLTSALMEGGKSSAYIEIGFLKESLRFPEWIHPAACKYQLVRSTDIPTTSPVVAHLVRTSDTTRDAALEQLLKYLPEINAQAVTESQKNRKLFERRDTKTERSLFPNMDWLVRRQRPISPQHPRTRAAAKPGDFQPSLIHTKWGIFLCCVNYTRNPKHLIQW